MFDGIDEIILPASTIAPLERLYVDQFGFTFIEEEVLDASPWQELWGLPIRPTRSLLLGKPQSNGGWIRLVEVPGLPAATPAGRPDKPGPYALDFYLRDPEHTERQVEAAGWNFRSPALHYSLPGTSIPVRERMLEQPVSGLVHASVKYRPKGTRCVLDHDPRETVSEVVALVSFTERYEEAKSFAVDVLGAQNYFEGRFDGPAVTEMLALDPDEGFRAALFRGPRSRNARLEFAEPLSGGTGPVEATPRVIARCAIDDLDRLAEQLVDGRYGISSGVLEFCTSYATHRRLGLRSVYGVNFEFFERE